MVSVLEHRGAVHFFGECRDSGAGGAEAPFALGLGRLGGVAEGVVKVPGAVVDDAVGPDVSRHVGQAGDDDGGDALPLKGPGQRSPAARAGPSRGGEDDALDPGLFELGGPGAADAVHVGEGPAVSAGAQEIIVKRGDFALALQLPEGVHGEHAIGLLVHEQGVEAAVDGDEGAARKGVFPLEGVGGPDPVARAGKAIRVAGGDHAALGHDGDAGFLGIGDGLRRRYLIEDGNFEFCLVGLPLDFLQEQIDGATRGRKLGDFVVADPPRKVAFIVGVADLLPPRELEPEAGGGLKGLFHPGGGFGGGDGVDAGSNSGKARIFGMHGGDDGDPRLQRGAADGGAGEPEAPGVERGPGEDEVWRKLPDQRDGLGGAGFLVFGEQTVPGENGAGDFGLLAQDFIEQKAGAGGAGPGGYGMIAFLLAPDAGEELVEVVNDSKFTAHGLASLYEFNPINSLARVTTTLLGEHPVG